jgi:hypothetical protein
MRVIFEVYTLQDEIPVKEYVKKRKLIKYFNRETSAAITGLAKLLKGQPLDPYTPFYYSRGWVEYEDIGLGKIVDASTNKKGKFSTAEFVEKGLSGISPLTQFKILYNMPLSFISIEHQLKGDNAIIYNSARGFILQALYAPEEGPVLLGAGRVYPDGRLETGFALIEKKEIRDHLVNNKFNEAIDIFRYLNET